MKNSIIIGFILAILLAILAIQNHISTELKLFFWKVYGSQSVILIFSFMIGILSGVLLCIPIIRKKK